MSHRPSSSEPLLIFGIHAVEAALRNSQRPVGRLFLTENARRRLGPALALRTVEPEAVTPRDLDRRLGKDTVHQGALLETAPLPEIGLADIAGRSGPILLLDRVTDPHNVGAVLRSAAAFGASALVLTRRHSPPLAGALAKAASGALDLVPVVLVQNLARALEELKSFRILCIGLDDAAEELLEDVAPAGPSALVLGAEGKGLRQRTRALCDRLCRIATAEPSMSLNVSNAAAVALHLVRLRARKV
ncbi:MAG: TrmH family RNA methyltransferase [Hyphomicrobiaceae bacterium]